jgi:hypothetical protein
LKPHNGSIRFFSDFLFPFNSMKLSLFTVVLSLCGVQSATIAELVRSRPELSEFAKSLSKNPEWADKNVMGTLFAPTNDALAAATSSTLNGASGEFYTKTVVPYISSHYIVLQSSDGKQRMVWGMK